VLIPHGLQLHIALEPVSPLKSISGLCAEVQRRFGDDPTGGHLFVFFDRDRTGMKALLWDNGGFIVVVTLPPSSSGYKSLATRRDLTVVLWGPIRAPSLR
jgi:hypothetical protein